MEEEAQLNTSQLFIVEDFNYLKIDWRHGSIPGDNAVSEEFQLVQTLRDIV